MCSPELTLVWITCYKLLSIRKSANAERVYDQKAARRMQKLPFDGCNSILSINSLAEEATYSTGLHRFSPTSKSSCPSAIHINCWGLPHRTVCIWTRPDDQSGWNPLGWKLLAGLNDFLNGHWVIQRSSHSPSRSKLWHHLGAPLTGDAPKRWQQQLWIHTNGIKNA
jgi:hypothetical protein